jgi:hypothetical protein
MQFLPLDLSTGGRPLLDLRPAIAGLIVHVFEPPAGCGLHSRLRSRDALDHDIWRCVGDDFRIGDEATFARTVLETGWGVLGWY